MFRSAFYYLFSAGVIAYAFLRISRGLDDTFETRKEFLIKHVTVLSVYVAYAVLLVILYVGMTLSERGEEDGDHGADNKTTTTLKYLVALCVGGRYANL